MYDFLLYDKFMNIPYAHNYKCLIITNDFSHFSRQSFFFSLFFHFFHALTFYTAIFSGTLLQSHLPHW